MRTVAHHPQVIGVAAEDAAGDELGAYLIRGLDAWRPELRFIGIGGHRMQAAGAQILASPERPHGHGYIEAFRHGWRFARMRRRLCEHFLRHKPALFMSFGASEFNLSLQLELRKAEIPTVQYVAPFAPTPGLPPLHKVKKAASLVLTSLPLDTLVYQHAGVPVKYVGHPLADLLSESPPLEHVREALRLPADVPVFALVAGDRTRHLQARAELFLRAAMVVNEALPHARFLVPLASREAKLMFEWARDRAGAHELNLTMMVGHAIEAVAAADVAVVATDADALDAALLGRPMVIITTPAPQTWWRRGRPAEPPIAAIPNVLAGERIVPELAHYEATPEQLACVLIDLFSDGDARRALEARFESIRAALRQNTVDKVASAIAPLLDGARI